MQKTRGQVDAKAKLRRSHPLNYYVFRRTNISTYIYKLLNAQNQPGEQRAIYAD